jgi:predicted molibdopterin-dependent oxidoreductase YjgC
MAMRELLRTPALARGTRFTIQVNGTPVAAHDGESVLAVLWAAGLHRLRRSPETMQPRGFCCGMGACFDCLVTIDGRANQRACLEPARAGMQVTTDASGEADHA